jgi:hypothetical protein
VRRDLLLLDQPSRDFSLIHRRCRRPDSRASSRTSLPCAPAWFETRRLRPGGSHASPRRRRSPRDRCR